jgi:hypothetical protein
MKMSNSHSRRQQILLLAFFVLMLAQVITPLAQAQNTGGQPAFNKAVQGQTASQPEVSRGFRNNVTSAPNTIMLMKTWDEETTRYFQNAASQVPAEKRTERVHRRNLFNEKYERTGWGNVTDAKEPCVPDEHIKNLPTGQMQVLITARALPGTPICMRAARRKPAQGFLGRQSIRLLNRPGHAQTAPICVSRTQRFRGVTRASQDGGVGRPSNEVAG